jgi:hypothetical protein
MKFREYLLNFGLVYFVFQSSIKEFDIKIQKTIITCSLVCIRQSVSHMSQTAQSVRILKHGPETKLFGLRRRY